MIIVAWLALLAAPLAQGQFDAHRQVIPPLSDETTWTWWTKP